ncbi:metal ABC transporter ATP-binding protein [Ammonifex thiophilus]|uniref:Metal ABC transporter ATP-binding protein n=1 Tax=Ammonifex thiophilus TaxID=444093 RepID=A0A3D8P1X1_9THEO|nr:metal ABC transporter ATP-binding protein [Ammonifex thiophilus]
MINGLARILHGEVKVLGHRVEKRFPSWLRRRVGYVPQIQNIDPRMPISAREVVMIGRYGKLGLLRRPGRRDWQVVDHMLELVGMTPLASRPIGHLSGGEQQRVAIARALAQEPEILLLDEPTTALDRRARESLVELIRQIHHAYRLTTLVVTHEIEVAKKLCDRVVLMREGLVWGEGPPEETLREEVLDRLFA